MTVTVGNRNILDLHTDKTTQAALTEYFTAKWMRRMFRNGEGLYFFAVHVETNEVLFSSGGHFPDQEFAGGIMGVTWGKNEGFTRCREYLLTPGNPDWISSIVRAGDDNPIHAGILFAVFYRLHFDALHRPKVITAMSIMLNDVELGSIVNYLHDTKRVDGSGIQEVCGSEHEDT